MIGFFDVFLGILGSIVIHIAFFLIATEKPFYWGEWLLKTVLSYF